MNVFDAVRNLGSFRSADDKPVERKKVGKILEAGRHAPSPGNVQSLEFIVIEEEESRAKLAEASGDPRLEEAPVAVIVLADTARMRRRIGDEFHDACNAEAASAVQGMRMVAKEEDLSSCWVTGFDQMAVKTGFGIPENVEPMGIIGLCYPRSEVEPDHRFGMNEVVFYEKYDNQVGSVFDGLEWEGIHENTEIASKKTKRFYWKLKERLSDLI
ncbi:nitroreductase family protein [Candidatus Nanohalococcus occultus]|uniref:nitroreductase family protein n=1 Tax=Candidatus Nanohalococcus occultus TaxID=2978047 RepID=UPI0039E030F6